MTQLCLAIDESSGSKAHSLVRRTGKPVALKFGVSSTLGLLDDGFGDFLRLEPVPKLLDFKLKDVPSSTKLAARKLSDLGATWITVSSVSWALRAAIEGVQGTNTGVLAVWALSSSQPYSIPHEEIDKALSAGAKGMIVPAAALTPQIRQWAKGALIFAVGIRPALWPLNDHIKTRTPREVAQLGADYAIIGRLITGHPNPSEEMERVREELLAK